MRRLLASLVSLFAPRVPRIRASRPPGAILTSPGSCLSFRLRPCALRLQPWCSPAPPAKHPATVGGCTRKTETASGENVGSAGVRGTRQPARLWPSVPAVLECERLAPQGSLLRPRGQGASGPGSSARVQQGHCWLHCSVLCVCAAAVLRWALVVTIHACVTYLRHKGIEGAL